MPFLVLQFCWKSSTKLLVDKIQFMKTYAEILKTSTGLIRTSALIWIPFTTACRQEAWRMTGSKDLNISLQMSRMLGRLVGFAGVTCRLERKWSDWTVLVSTSCVKLARWHGSPTTTPVQCAEPDSREI